MPEIVEAYTLARQTDPFQQARGRAVTQVGGVEQGAGLLGEDEALILLDAVVGNWPASRVV